MQACSRRQVTKQSAWTAHVCPARERRSCEGAANPHTESTLDAQHCRRRVGRFWPVSGRCSRRCTEALHMACCQVTHCRAVIGESAVRRVAVVVHVCNTMSCLVAGTHACACSDRHRLHHREQRAFAHVCTFFFREHPDPVISTVKSRTRPTRLPAPESTP
jgi:hypothetical protein